MTPNNVVSLAEAVIREFEVQARQKSIRLRLENDQPSVFAERDRQRIVQVIGNLFENALKFSPEGSEIVRHIRRLEEGGSDTLAGKGLSHGILISVRDSGPGVPDEHKHKIFQKFHQTQHGKKVAGQGVGLGLAICSTIVEAHRGQIWVEDNPN